MEASYYPTFVNVRGKQCVIVGGGKVAERKVLSLLRLGATIRLISPEVTSRLASEIKKGKIEYVSRHYKSGDLEGAFLVIAATSDQKINRLVASESPCLVNVVDAPELANFIVPSVIQRGLMTIAVSTSGISPAMAKSIRLELQDFYGSSFGKYLVFLKKLRKKVLTDINCRKSRRRLFKEIASKKMLAILREKGYKEARDTALKMLREVVSPNSSA